MSSLLQDSLGLFYLNDQIPIRLNEYLSTNENKLAAFIFLQFFPESEIINFPSLPVSYDLKISSLMTFLENHISEIQNNTPPNFWDDRIPKINNAFWKFLETIQGNAVELFQRVKQLDLLDYSDDYEEIVTKIKEVLLQYVQVLIDAIESLENFLRRLKVKDEFIKKIWSLFSYNLDKNLLLNLFNSKLFLENNYDKFKKKFESFKLQSIIAKRKLKKVKNFICFSSLDKEFRKQLLNLYKIVQLWKENAKEKVFERTDFLRTIKQYLPGNFTYLLLNRYLTKITDSFFYMAEEWRLGKNAIHQEQIKDLELELLSFSSLIESYRKMLLDTDPNPYVRTRLGFRETIVGNEPIRTQELQKILFNSEGLKHIFEKFKLSTAIETPEDPKAKYYRLKNEIQDILHEMEQPLASRIMMKIRTDRLLSLLDDCDEIGGSTGDVTNFITNTLLKAFQIDWYYQVLFENPRFNQLWIIHLHSEKKEKDFLHERRMEFFKDIIQQIEDWVKEKDTLKHIHDLETDFSDIKEQLQEYLSLVKRKYGSMDDFDKSFYKEQIKVQLLEYYELFDRFFIFLGNMNLMAKWSSINFSL